MEGEAQASMETNVGLAKAQAIDAQVKAYGGAEYRVIQEIADKLTDAIKNSKVDIVPKTVVNMGGSGSQESSSNNNSTVMDTLLKFITLDKLGVSLQHISEPSTTAQAIEAITKPAKVGTEPQTSATESTPAPVPSAPTAKAETAPKTTDMPKKTK
jgi:hypothetical protein